MKKRRTRIVPEIVFATAVSACVIPGLVTACSGDATGTGDDHGGSAGKTGTAGSASGGRQGGVAAGGFGAFFSVAAPFGGRANGGTSSGGANSGGYGLVGSVAAGGFGVAAPFGGRPGGGGGSGGTSGAAGRGGAGGTSGAAGRGGAGGTSGAAGRGNAGFAGFLFTVAAPFGGRSGGGGQNSGGKSASNGELRETAKPPARGPFRDFESEPELAVSDQHEATAPKKEST